MKRPSSLVELTYKLYPPVRCLFLIHYLFSVVYRSELIEVGLYAGGEVQVNGRIVRLPYEASGEEDVTIKPMGVYNMFEGFNGKN